MNDMFNMRIALDDNWLEPPAVDGDDEMMPIDDDFLERGDAFERHITPPPFRYDEIGW